MLLPAGALLLADRSLLALLPIAAAALHEAGHLLAMAAFGVPVREIGITPLGAEIRTAPHPPDALRDGIIHLAGPAANLLGAGMLLVPSGTAGTIFGFSSLALALFNLLPVQSLDGGHALAAALTRLSPERAACISAAASAAAMFLLWFAAGYLLLLCGGNLSLFVICVFLFAELYLK